MKKSFLKSLRLRDFTSIPFEIFIVLFSLLPFVALAYFYPVLPTRVPVFLNLSGEVTTWAEKSVLAVFRVPLMAFDTQLVCLLMKYATVASVTVAPAESAVKQDDYRNRYVRLNVGLWDWFRALVAVKMGAGSLDTVFLSVERFKFLARPAFAITAIAALLSVVGAIFYGYRFLVLRREMKEKFGTEWLVRPIDAQSVYGGFLYFSPSDSALLVSRYIFNFANKWSWVFIACLIAYPLLVFMSI